MDGSTYDVAHFLNGFSELLLLHGDGWVVME